MAEHETDSLAELLTEVAARYGVQIDDAALLPGEFDRTVRLTIRDAEPLLLKVSPARPSTPPTDIDLRWQNKVLDVLAEDETVPAPQLVPSLAGHDMETFAWAGQDHHLRVLRWLPGNTLADLTRHGPRLWEQWGTLAGNLVRALGPLNPPEGARTTHEWDLLRAPQTITTLRHAVVDPDHQRVVTTMLEWFDHHVQPRIDALPRQVVHQDLNDHNVLATDHGAGPQITGVIDFTDTLKTATVVEPAIAAAYAMLRQSDPLAALLGVAAGYHRIIALATDEIDAFYPLATTRLLLNAVTWTHRDDGSPTSYGRSRSKHTWSALQQLMKLPPAGVAAAIRRRLDISAPTPARALHQWIEQVTLYAAPVVDRPHAVDLRVTSHLFDDLLPAAATELDVRNAIHVGVTQDEVPVGAHLTSRFDRLRRRRTGTDEPATIHLGCDLYPRAGTVISAPFAGAASLHGNTLLVAHEEPGGPAFVTAWTELVNPVTGFITAGARLGTSGSSPVAVAIHPDHETARCADGRFVPPTHADIWRSASPDPAALLGMNSVAERHWAIADVERVRDRHIARSQRSYYHQPMNLVRGNGAWLYDENGLAYLDAINNVSHVGHANPRVADAVSRQSRRLNTNSRLVYDGIARYAQRLVANLPDPLDVVFLVCSGSEANDLALRIARQVTGRQDIIVIDGAYHGNTTAVTGISPSRYKGPGGAGAPPTTHEVRSPDRYRGTFGYDHPDAGPAYAADIADTARRLQLANRPPAAFIAESLQGTAGNIVYPPGYLSTAFDHARDAGALCISDEVQVGFGRTGATFWCFESQDVIPDIVTMGKPMGNGHPLAAVATTREIADAFDTGMKYFNTFGGNPVSCEVGLAVLDEIADNKLQDRARSVGAYFLDRLHHLASINPIIGDVRGAGLYIGIELVVDQRTKQPAKTEAYAIAETMKNQGVIVYPTGVHDNVLKIKPPMVFTAEDVDIFVDTLAEVINDQDQVLLASTTAEAKSVAASE